MGASAGTTPITASPNAIVGGNAIGDLSGMSGVMAPVQQAGMNPILQMMLQKQMAGGGLGQQAQGVPQVQLGAASAPNPSATIAPGPVQQAIVRNLMGR